MAIIYSYPEKTSPAGGDFLVITDSEQPAPKKNRTKSLTIDNLAKYVVTSTSSITGSGTLNTIAMFTPDGQKIGDSFITQTILPNAVNVSGRFNVSPGGVNALNVSQTGGTTGVVTIPGSLEVDGTYYDASGDEGTDGDVLVAKGTPGNMVTRWVSKANADIVSGSGTLNTIAMFTPDGQTIGDSGITQSSPEIIKIGTGIAGGSSVLETNLLTCNIISGANLLTIQGNSIIGNEATDVLTVNSETEFNANVVFDLPGYVELRGAVRDNTGSPGAAGQVLSSTGTGVAWIAGGDTNTTYDLTGAVSGANDYKVVLTGSDGTIDNVNFEAGNGISLVDQGTNTVSINAINNGTVTGTGTTNTLPIWSNGPNGVLGDSGITQTFNANNKITNITLATNGADPNSLSASFGTGGSCRFSTGDSGEFMRLTAEVDGFYKSRFRFQNKVTVDRNSSSTGPSLDVGESSRTYAAAWFRNGVVVSNNPSGVQVDNTSMVIGAGNNDVVTGSDNCLAVGNNNQILSDSDNSLAVGQGNIIRNNADNSFAIGQNNTIDGTAAAQSVKSQVLGFNNSLTGSYSSFIAGGQNTVTTNQNAVALGFSHTLGGDDSMFAFGENNTGPSGATDNNSFMIGGNLTGTDGSMALGFRNDTSSYPTTDYSNGLGNTKFVVSVGTVTNSNAMIITEGGVTRGGGTTQVPRVILPTVTGFEYANGTLAKAAGVPVGGLFHTAGVLKIVLSTD